MKNKVIYFVFFIVSQMTLGQNIKLNFNIDDKPSFLSKYTKQQLEEMITDSIVKKCSEFYKETYHKSINIYTHQAKNQPKPDYILDIHLSDTISLGNTTERANKLSKRIYESNTPDSLIPKYSYFKYRESNKNEDYQINFLSGYAMTYAGVCLKNITFSTQLSPYNSPVDSIGGEHKTFLIYFIDKTDKKMPEAVKQVKQLINNYFVLKQYETYHLYKRKKKDDCYKYLLVDASSIDISPSENTLLVPILLETEKGNLKVTIAKESTYLKLKSMGEPVQQIHLINPVVLEKYPATLTKFQDSFGWLIRINTQW